MLFHKFNSFLNKFFLSVYAESQITTVVTEGSVAAGTAVILSNAVRMVYSKEIEFKALPNMRYFQFATLKRELGVEPGLTISMMTYNNLKTGGKLTEGIRMTTQALSSSMKQITVGERGNAVSVSELTLKSTFDDTMAAATELLARDMALVLDLELRDTALGCTNKVYARKPDGSRVTARAGLTKDCFLSVATIKDSVEILATNNAPKIDNNYYICFVHPHQSRTLRDDSDWIEASKYGAPDQLFTGEIGRIDDVRFIETTLQPNANCAVDDPAYKAELALDPDSTPNSGDEFSVYQAVIFGDRYYGLAIALPVELRDNGVTDFGREHGLAWYAIWGTAILHNENGVLVETA